MSCLCLALVGCPHSSDGTAEPTDPLERARLDDMEAIAQDCLELLEDYRETDMSEASEAELERQMEEASLNEELCAQAFVESYRGPGGTVMANHLARSMTIHSLQAELALSERFDEMAGYCEILLDLVRLLEADANELASALERAEDLPERDVAVLAPLYELTVQSLQVSVVDYVETCDSRGR